MIISLSELGDLLIVDNHEVSPRAVAEPLDAAELEDLRWYFEDRPLIPIGGDAARAKRICNKIPEWGSKIFRLLFEKSGANLPTKGHPIFYVDASKSALLAIPWEILYEESLGGFLAPQLIPIVRYLQKDSTGTAGESNHRGLLGNAGVQVLVVIPRPRGMGMIPVHAVAEGVLEVADSLGSDVVIDLLRPPTLANLRETLKTKHYDVVHFDGHGDHTTEHAYAGSYLFFENEAGERDAVHAGRRERLSRQHRYPSLF